MCIEITYFHHRPLHITRDISVTLAVEEQFKIDCYISHVILVNSLFLCLAANRPLHITSDISITVAFENGLHTHRPLHITSDISVTLAFGGSNPTVTYHQ